MSRPKLEITAAGKSGAAKGAGREVVLQNGLTRLGGADARGIDVKIAGAEGELHVWDDPPKVVRVRGEEALVGQGGEMADEFVLENGTTFVWAGTRFRFSHEPVLQEIIEEEPAVTAGPSGGYGAAMSTDERRAFERVAAGLLVDAGLADKKVAKRWQAAVVQKQWDADACAREVIASAGPGALGDLGLIERAGRLERDLVMASFQRGIKGAARRARGKARSTTAFFVANLVAILVYSAIILALLIAARVGYDWSLDAIVDRIVGVFRSEAP